MTVLLREAIGDRLRHARTTKRRTLRDISRAARVSLGYLSEVERGQKEASSELLASICEALDLPLPELLHNVASDVSALGTVEAAGAESAVPLPAEAGARESVGAREPVGREAVAEDLAEGLEEARPVTGAAGEFGDFRLSPTLRTTIPAPESKAVLAA
ncbi:helix-turn-helix domain-containing protein [Saccharomonospora halophila]|uniref:helix-turn-helix domain-containing protein n=1 Tax=Saccharomonospora halophila TaxID=129922 RepID=UPI000379BD11|nr:helix-turn-helix transcriptional regulator [Saccharomonospora halophila]